MPPERSDNGELENGNYVAVYECTLGRDPRKLSEESLMTIELGGADKPANVAFKYNWAEKRATLPKDEAEMQGWVGHAREFAVSNLFVV